MVAAEPSLADSGVLGPLCASIRTTRLLLYALETPRRPHVPPGAVTDLDTEHGGTDPTSGTGRDRLDG